MPDVLEPLVLPTTEEGTKDKSKLDKPYVTICWNDPVNLMNFVTHVFMKVFGMDNETAQKHMNEVHKNGKSILYRGGAEKAEHYVHQLQSYKLKATMEPAE